VFETPIAGNAKDPRPQEGGRLIAREGAQNGQKDLLGHVFPIRGIVQQRRTVLHHNGLVALQQDLKCLRELPDCQGRLYLRIIGA
jgi:hypothetical protein